MANDKADDGSAGGLDSPGGGPRRVRSERSVDDILASVRDDEGTEPSTDEDRVESDRTVSSVEPAGEEATGDDGDESTDARDDDSTGAGDGTDETPSSGDAATENDPTTDGDGTGGGPASGADEPAARVETGEVSGADVRAAETGADRDPTPEIDEVDLSLDDLDSVASGSSSDREDVVTRDAASDREDATTGDAAGDREDATTGDAAGTNGSSSDAAASAAGPLAGSVDEIGGSESSPDDEDGESTGLLGRLRGLFSRSS